MYLGLYIVWKLHKCDSDPTEPVGERSLAYQPGVAHLRPEWSFSRRCPSSTQDIEEAFGGFSVVLAQDSAYPPVWKACWQLSACATEPIDT